MAKIAKVGYGSDGRGLGRTKNEEPEGWTYIVNDNVQAGQRIQAVATSKKGRQFATTALVRHAFKTSPDNAPTKDREGDIIKQESLDTMADYGLEPKLKWAFTGKELGATGSRAIGHPDAGSKQKHSIASTYQQIARAKSLELYKQENPEAELTKNATKTMDTFDSYSAPFMKGEQ